ncbi:hypothetical protein CN918_32285 [Priestia megaterium]|nr:hypothetical protein CN918_32285 [Priestia megaterium]
MKKFITSLLILLTVSSGLYAIGYTLNEPLLMLRYEQYREGYLVESGGSVLPLLIGSFCAALLGGKKKKRVR